MASRVRDVADLAGVSAATVSNVFNHPERVSDEATLKVRSAIAQLGFVRNDAARQLRDGRSRTIGLIVLDMHPFFVDLALGAAGQAEAQGYSVLVANADHDLKRETAYLELFAEQRVHGVLISPTGDFKERLHRFNNHGIPVVLVDRFDAQGFSSVSVDDVQGGRLAAEHLLKMGRRRLCFVGGPVSVRQVADRLGGASDEVGAVFGARLEIVGVPELTVLAGQAAGKEIAGRLKEQRPDGVFAANDLVAFGILQSLSEANIKIPEDIAVVGYDDIDFAAAASVPLTSVRQPGNMIGRAAVDILLSEAKGDVESPRNIVYVPELIVRKSTNGQRVERVDQASG